MAVGGSDWGRISRRRRRARQKLAAVKGGDAARGENERVLSRSTGRGWRRGRAYNLRGSAATDEPTDGSRNGGGEGVAERAALVQGWFRVVEVEPGVFLIEEPLQDERVKAYLIVGRERAVLLDAGTGAGDLPGVVSGLTRLPLTLVVSHAHWDHIGQAHAFAEAGAEVLVHDEQAAALAAGVGNERVRGFFAPERLTGSLPVGFNLETATIPPVAGAGRLEEGAMLDLGGRRLDVVLAPGHAPGLLTLLDREGGLLFSTDAAYAGALYAQMGDSDISAYRTSLDRLAALAPGLRAVYPAHGPAPIEPAALVAMRDAVAAVAGGRTPEEVDDGVAEHRFDGFSVLVGA